MKSDSNQFYAVLTGDVIGSSKLNATTRKLLPDALKNASKATRSFFKKQIPLEADIFRGDSWQLAVADAAIGLRAAIFFRAHLRGNSSDEKLDTRISIGIGSITFLPKERVSQGDGPAFRESGKLLETMPKNRRLALSIADGKTPAGVTAVVSLLDALMIRWTSKQSLAVLGALRELTQEQIAASSNPPVKQQVVARHLQQANWDAVEEALNYTENSLKTMRLQNTPL